MTYTELFDTYPLILISGAAIIGLLIGSFLNVVIYRLPVMMEKEWQSECRLILQLEDEASNDAVFNLAQPNSHCPGCQKEISPWQNIPVISYLLLKGQCSNCGTHISLRYPLIEALTAILSAIVVWQLGFTPLALVGLLFTWALICLTMIDADTKMLPDQITLPLLWLGLIINIQSVNVDLQSAVLGAIFGYLSLWSVYWAFKLVTGKEGMGYGDFKLLAALGAWMGWQALPVIILLSSLVGAVLGILILVINKQGKDTALPFGPYLAAAGWIAFLWGDQISAAYLRFSGLQ